MLAKVCSAAVNGIELYPVEADVNWTALVPNSPTNGTFTFTDLGATSRNPIYRAVKQQGGEGNTRSEVPKRTSVTTRKSL
jgi:hypothetical protein